jgi:hypothetical protein
MTAVGLCPTCAHSRRVQGARSEFILCELAATKPAYPRYPPQPVVRCEGYRPSAMEEQENPQDRGDDVDHHRRLER